MSVIPHLGKQPFKYLDYYITRLKIEKKNPYSHLVASPSFHKARRWRFFIPNSPFLTNRLTTFLTSTLPTSTSVQPSVTPSHTSTGKLVLKIPWKNLYTAPVVVLVERLHLLAVPSQGVSYNREREDAIARELRKQQISRYEQRQQLTDSEYRDGDRKQGGGGHHRPGAQEAADQPM